MKQTNYILQAAVAAALGVSGAQAASLAGTATVFAKEVLANADATTSVTTASGLSLVIDGSENYINRLQPLNIKVQLSGGAKFSAVAVGTYQFGSANTAGTISVTASVGGVSGFTPTVVGGGAGSTFVTFTIDPTGTGLKRGALNLSGIQLNTINSTLKAGTSVTADITLIDPTTNTTLQTLTGQTIASAANAVTFACNASNSAEKIDVTTSSKFFDGATSDVTFAAGTVSVSISAATYYNVSGSVLSTAELSALTFTVAGLSDFSSFIGTGASIVIGATTATTTTTTGATFTIGSAAAATGVVFTADGVDAIAEGTPTVALTGGLLNGVTGVAASTACNLQPLVKNGFSAKFPLWFAAADGGYNKSYARLVNYSSVAGKAFITVRSADGTAVGTANAPVDVAASTAYLWDASAIETVIGATLTSGQFYRLDISSTLPTTTKVQNYVLAPNGSVTNITAEK